MSDQQLTPSQMSLLEDLMSLHLHGLSAPQPVPRKEERIIQQFRKLLTISDGSSVQHSTGPLEAITT